MPSTEQKLRDAAQGFQDALLDAKAEGLHVVWPVHPDQLNALAISETGKFASAIVANLDGSPVERDEDGLIKGQPINLTEEERAGLPALGQVDPNASAEYGYALSASTGLQDGFAVAAGEVMPEPATPSPKKRP